MPWWAWAISMFVAGVLFACGLAWFLQWLDTYGLLGKQDYPH